MLDLNKKFDEKFVIPNIIRLLPKDFTKHDTEIKIDSSFKYFESILLLGKSKKLNNLNIYIIKTNNDGKNRITLSRDIFKLLKLYVIENALVILHSNDGSYRLSYVKYALNWEDNNKINRTFSNPKRLSYLLGPNAKVHTPYNKFFRKGTIENIEDLELLRFLELGFEVKMIKMSNVSVSVDTISSLNLVRKILLKKKKI